MGARMKLFYLDRITDETGISGTGVVARGVVFPSGKCVLEWQTKHTSVAVYASIDEVRAIHGHDGKTKVVILEDAQDALGAMKKIGRNRVMDDFYAFGMMDIADRVASFFGVRLDNETEQDRDFGLVAECSTCGVKRKKAAA